MFVFPKGSEMEMKLMLHNNNAICSATREQLLQKSKADCFFQFKIYKANQPFETRCNKLSDLFQILKNRLVKSH